MLAKRWMLNTVSRNMPALRRPPLADDREHHHQEDPVMKRSATRASAVGVRGDAGLLFCSAGANQDHHAVLGRVRIQPTRSSSCPKDFTAKTGINMKFEFVPWPSLRRPFAQRAQLEGQAVRSDDRRQPMDRRRRRRTGTTSSSTTSSPRNGIKMSDFMPADGARLFRVAEEHAELLGAAGDGRRGRAGRYRKDWFAQAGAAEAEFKAQVRTRPRAAEDVGRVPAGRRSSSRTATDRRQEGLRRYIFTERGSEGITMGVTNVLYPYGFKYDNPKKPYQMEGFVNSPDAVKGLEVYKALLQVLHRAGHDQRLHAGRPRRLQVRPGGDADELVRVLPGPVQGRNVGANKIGFFVNPAATKQYTQLGGQGISVVAYSEPQRTTRCSTSSGSRSPTCRRNGGRWAATRA